MPKFYSQLNVLNFVSVYETRVKLKLQKKLFAVSVKSKHTSSMHFRNVPQKVIPLYEGLIK